MAAEAVTPEKIAFFLAHTSGVICVPARCPSGPSDLDLPLMVTDNTESQRTAFTVSVDYRHGTTTGISAADRASTIHALIDPTPSDRPQPTRPHLPASATAPVGCSSAPATPRPRSTSPGGRGHVPRRGCSARW